jgi:serine/threonine-protein kinase
VTPSPSTSQPSPLVPGLFLDRYELLCPIAKGGMAEVWVARLRGKHGFQKLVAIKTILPEYAADPTFQTMFLDEAHISAGIEHVNVAHILDLGEQHDVLYIVMEFVDGESLSRLQRSVHKKGFKIPQGLVLRVLSDTCMGLHAAHELRDKNNQILNVVHRDVSPQNILVSDKGVAKLIDFGVAKARDRVAGETNAGILKGKVQYMPPEQAMGGVVDRRADVFAIGAIAYHMLSGRPPYDGDNQLAMLRALTSGEPPAPLPSSVPMLVADVVMRALSFEKESRWSTALELHRAIEAAMNESGLATSTADVGAFVAEHLHSRSAERRRAVDLALEAAAERERVHALLQPNLSETASGLINVTASSMAALAPAPIPSESAQLYAAEPPTLKSAPSIGSIGLFEALGSTSSVPAPAPAPTRGRSALAIAVGAIAVAVIGATIGITLGRRGASASTIVNSTTTTRTDKSTAANAEVTATVVESASAAPSESTTAAPSTSASVPASASIAAAIQPGVIAMAVPTATDAPKASATPSTTALVAPSATAVATGTATATTTATATATATATTAKPASTKVDDGF